MNAKYKKIIFLLLLLAGCATTSLLSSDKEELAPAASFSRAGVQSADGQRSGKTQGKTIRVQVSGAVLEPGIYDLPTDSRAEAAIAAAGGLTEAADTERVNMVRKLRDGMLLKVPALKAGGGKKAAKRAAGAAGASGNAANAHGKNAVDKRGASKVAAQGSAGRVRINSASVSELQSLPGVGPALAQRIIAERSRGRFASAEDLLRVSGIGKAKLEKMRAYVEVD
ncbi:ComEA family DNA-binding protein [uncultured Phascolarctobacterium sp.]|uniref:ComEA family DNA-binding protein n=1 Tax=uncultured Phascolarctobacterium sp. TaxID=512296 RepID=UPI0026008446|nr:ComEA family DNA-binding protein [uncultured Phascolarctobacterium sp.]